MIQVAHFRSGSVYWDDNDPHGMTIVLDGEEKHIIASLFNTSREYSRRQNCQARRAFGSFRQAEAWAKQQIAAQAKPWPFGTKAVVYVAWIDGVNEYHSRKIMRVLRKHPTGKATIIYRGMTLPVSKSRKGDMWAFVEDAIV